MQALLLVAAALHGESGKDGRGLYRTMPGEGEWRVTLAAAAGAFKPHIKLEVANCDLKMANFSAM